MNTQQFIISYRNKFSDKVARQSWTYKFSYKPTKNITINMENSLSSNITKN